MLTILLIVLLVLALICVLIIICDSNRFIIKEYTIESDRIDKPSDFLFISDLHCKEYGKANKRLIKAIDSVKADYSIIGGDLIVSKWNNKTDTGLDFADALSKRMPVYFALGNHEYRAKLHPDRYGDMYERVKKRLEDCRITILDDENVEINGVRFYGYSMDEPFYLRRLKMTMTEEDVYSHTGKPDDSTYNILLAHDPEYFDAYALTDFDLILSGHFHGGVARLPYIGGVISPRFKLFPKYSGGFYEKNKSKMIVSCGLGMHSVPLRFLNPAELIIIHLKRKTQ